MTPARTVRLRAPKIRVTGLHGYGHDDLVNGSEDRGLAGALHERIALSVRQYSGTWNRVLADLAAISGHDAGLAEAARADLLAWLQNGAATSYGGPSPAQAAEIGGLLATGKLSQQQCREVAFVAGIRMPANGS